MLVGGSVITAKDFSGRSNSIGGAKYIAAFKEKHAKLVALMHTVCQKPGSKWKILDTNEAINAEWRSAKKHGKPGQVVVLASGGESVVTPAKVMTFSKFQSSITKIDATRTISSTEAARVRR